MGQGVMKRYISITFIIIEAALYIIFMTLDLSAYSGSTIVLKYIGILLCVAFSVFCAIRGGAKLIPVALAFTAVADFFLLVLNQYYAIGLIFFLVVQAIYLFYLYRETGKIWIPARIICAGLIVLLLWVLHMLSGVNLEAGIYFSLILINMAMSWTRGGRAGRLFAVGLTLFVCCDICVGLYNLYGMLPDGLYAFTSIGMWMFYLPSQVLIALSMLQPEEEKQ